MKRIVLTHGLSAAAILLAWVVWIWLSGRDVSTDYYDSGEKIGYTVMVLAMCLIFFAIKRVRDDELGGILSFSRGVAIGTYTNLVASVIFGLFNVIYLRFLAPEFLPTYTEYYRDKIATSNAPADEIATQLADLDANKEMFLNPEFNAFLMFASVFLIGLVITLISSAILKKSH